MQKWDVAIIGGGASGLAAACAAGAAGARTVILERGDRVGRKLLATGNGKCNLGNTAAGDLRNYFSETPELVAQVLTQCTPERAVAYLNSFGLLTRTDSEGRIYPYSEQAATVLDVLRGTAAARGAEERCSFEAQQVQRTGEGFLIKSKAGETIAAKTVVVACGGPAAPANGGTDSGTALLRSMGHPVTAMHPSLTPLKTDEKRTRALKGVRVKCAVTLMQDNRPLAKEQGELQFGEGQLSGICIFQLSRTAGALLAKGAKNLEISVDLLPELPPEETRGLVEARRGLWERPADQYFVGLLAKKIGQELLRGIVAEPAKRPAGTLTRSETEQLARRCRDWRFPVLGTGTYANAQVTAGGVRLDSFHPRTMQSKKVPGLFACGEVLDVDGLCGGFNLTWAWCSGILAGTGSAWLARKGAKK